jgi:CheY-like chemotaxis protein
VTSSRVFRGFPTSAAPEAQLTIPVPSRPTILLVDDYVDALEVWGLYLRAAGYNVLTASDGLTALSVATDARPDLVVLDLELPGKSGFEVATILRAQSVTRDLPIIAATGYSHARQLDLARKSGFDAILIKPCDPDVLLGEIRRLLARRAERGIP